MPPLHTKENNAYTKQKSINETSNRIESVIR